MKKHSGHLRTLEKCRKHSPAARVSYISFVFSNARHVLSQCNTRLRLLYLLNNCDKTFLEKNNNNNNKKTNAGLLLRFIIRSNTDKRYKVGSLRQCYTALMRCLLKQRLLLQDMTHYAKFLVVSLTPEALLNQSFPNFLFETLPVLPRT